MSRDCIDCRERWGLTVELLRPLVELAAAAAAVAGGGDGQRRHSVRFVARLAALVCSDCCLKVKNLKIKF